MTKDNFSFEGLPRRAVHDFFGGKSPEKKESENANDYARRLLFELEDLINLGLDTVGLKYSEEDKEEMRDAISVLKNKIKRTGDRLP